MGQQHMNSKMSCYFIHFVWCVVVGVVVSGVVVGVVVVVVVP